MKKKLESELISIAHRILKLKNKSELVQLHQETQKLYEKLSILRFWEENFEDAKPTIGHAEIEEKLETAFENRETNSEVEMQTEPVDEKEEIATVQEDSGDSEQAEQKEVEETLDDSNEPFEVAKEETKPDTNEPFKNEIIFDVAEPKAPTQKFTLEDLLSDVSSDPIFERVVKKEENESKKIEESIEVEESKKSKESKISKESIEEEVVAEAEIEVAEKAEPVEEEEIPEIEEIIETEATSEILEEIIHEEPIIPSKEIPNNESSKKTITLGLNDRVAFEKHLFGGSAEDLNRVISQLITYDTFEEAQDFIEDMVKPDYKNWEGKEEYALRFMDIVEKKFH